MNALCSGKPLVEEPAHTWGPAGFVLRDLPDATLVSRITCERLLKEKDREPEAFLRGMLACAEGDYVRVVVLSGKAGSGLVPDQGGADSPDFVRRDLFAVAGAPENDSQAWPVILEVAGDVLSSRYTKFGIVILRVEGGRPVVDHLISQVGEFPLQRLT